MRENGRRLDEPRPVTIEPGIMPFAEGSVLITCGRTRVICSASLEERVPPFLVNQSRGWITAEYALLPRSTHSRTSRESLAKGRTHEIQRLIGRSLRAGVRLEKLTGFTITLDCDVLQADGGTRTAAVSGSWVALRQALRYMFGDDLPEGLLRFPWLAAISVGVVKGESLLDLDYEEDHLASTDMNVVMGSDGSLVEVQATAEGEPFSRTQLQGMIDLAQSGVEKLFAIQEQALLKAGNPRSRA